MAGLMRNLADVNKALLVSFTMGISMAASAEPSLFDMSLEELLKVRVVSAASGYTQHAEDAPATVSIIYAEEWQAKGASTLSDAIQALPGVYLSKVQTGVIKDKVSLRGLSGAFGEQILILIDGKPFRQMINAGALYAQRIPLSGFKRIEVVKGPGSAIYGADAVGGVINLVSYEAGKAPSEMAVRYGDFNSLELAASHSVDWGKNTFQVGFEYQRSDDDDSKVVQSDLQSDFDFLFGTNASQAPGPIDEHYEIYGLKFQWFREGLRFDVYDWQNLGSGVGGGVAQALDPNGYVKQRVTHYDFTADLSGKSKTQTDLRLSYKKEKIETLYHIFPAGAILPIGSDGNFNPVEPVNNVSFPDGYIGAPGTDNFGYSASLTQMFDLGESHFIRWELGYEYNEILGTEQKNFGPSVIDGSQTVVDGSLTDVTNTPYSYLPRKERNIYFISLQDEWEIKDNLRATLGVRYDKYSDFGETTNPRLGIIWNASKLLSVKLFAGTAFRAPSFVDLYTDNNPATIGNPKLEPEKIKTIDSGLTLNYLSEKNFQISASMYEYAAENLIEFVTDEESGTQVAQNIGEQKGKGFELSGQWRGIDDLSLEFNYSFLDCEDGAGNNCGDMPGKMANLISHWTPGSKVHFYLGAKWLAGFDRPPGDERPEIDDYFWISSKLEYRFDRLSISLNAENLLDEDARAPSNGSIREDFPLHGRKLLVETKWIF